MFSRHFLRISCGHRQDWHPSAGELWRQQPKGSQGLKCRAQCLPSLELGQAFGIHPDVPPRTPRLSCHPHLRLSGLSELLGASSASPEHPGLPDWGVRGLFSARSTKHRARTRGQPPPAPPPPPPSRPSPQAPPSRGSRERPVVIFNLSSLVLLTTHVWVWPPLGDNIWGRTSGGYSSRPPRAAAPAPRPGMGHM